MLCRGITHFDLAISSAGIVICRGVLDTRDLLMITTMLLMHLLQRRECIFIFEVEYIVLLVL
jgi:hypothetical protein